MGDKVPAFIDSILNDPHGDAALRDQMELIKEKKKTCFWNKYNYYLPFGVIFE